MNLFDRLSKLKPFRPLSQLPINQEVPNIKQEVPKVEKVPKLGPLRLCTMEYPDPLSIPSTFKVYDEYKRPEYLGHSFLDQYQNMVIDIRTPDNTRSELHLRKLSTGDCTFANREGVSVTLSRGISSKFDRWSLRLREHKYTVAASSLGPITILWADNDKLMIARLHFYSTTRVACFSSQIVSDLHLTALMSVIMWYYRQHRDFGLERFVKLDKANRPISIQGSSSDYPTLRRQTGSISSADRVNANNLRRQSIATCSVSSDNSTITSRTRSWSPATYSDRDDATITSRTRLLSPEPIYEEATERENCDPGPSK